MRELTDKLKPCPFGCKSKIVALAIGTQAEIFCDDCGCIRGFQISDKFPDADFDMTTCCYSLDVREKCIKMLVDMWNTRINN